MKKAPGAKSGPLEQIRTFFHRDVEKARENYARGHDRESLAGFERGLIIAEAELLGQFEL